MDCLQWRRAWCAAVFLPAFAAAADPPKNPRDAQTWYRAAREEAAKIADPQARHLIGQIASSSQPITRAEADRQVAELRVKYAGDPRAQGWPLAVEVARTYQTLGFIRPAAEECLEAARAVRQAGADRAAQIQMDGHLHSLALAATAAGEVPLARALIDEMSVPDRRAAAGLAAAYQAKDTADADALLESYGGEQIAENRPLLLISRFPRSPADADRALEAVLKAAPTATPERLDRLLSHVRQFMRVAPERCDPAMIERFAEFLEQTRAKPAEGRAAVQARDEATSCLAALRLAQARPAEAAKIVQELPDLMFSVRYETAIALLQAGKLEEAAALSRHISPALAAAYVAAGRPLAALDEARKLDDLQAAYPHIIGAAKLLLASKDGESLERALNELQFSDLRAHGLVAVARQAFAAGEVPRAREFLARAEKLVIETQDESLRRSAGIAVAAGFRQLGATAKCEGLLKQYGDSEARCNLHFSAAHLALESGKKDEFRRELEATLELLGDARNWVPHRGRARPAAAPEFAHTVRPRVLTPTNENARPIAPYAAAPAVAAPAATADDAAPVHDMLFVYYVQAALLYQRAGDAEQTRKTAAAAVAANREVGGVFWRVETYGSLLEERTPERLELISAMAGSAENPVDRAILLAFGGVLARDLEKQGK